MMDPRELRTCHFCGDKRPDGYIAVKTRPVIIDGKTSGEEKELYCTDRQTCRLAAQKWWSVIS